MPQLETPQLKAVELNEMLDHLTGLLDDKTLVSVAIKSPITQAFAATEINLWAPVDKFANATLQDFLRVAMQRTQNLRSAIQQLTNIVISLTEPPPPTDELPAPEVH